MDYSQEKCQVKTIFDYMSIEYIHMNSFVNELGDVLRNSYGNRLGTGLGNTVYIGPKNANGNNAGQKVHLSG